MSKTAEEYSKEFDSMYRDHTPDLLVSKAEQAALEAYPYFPTEVNLFGHKTITADGNSHYRGIYIKGYEQAEKDLSLTIEDIEKIHTFLYAVKNNKQGVFTFTRLSDEQYKEVLRRFKAIKEEKK